MILALLLGGCWERDPEKVEEEQDALRPHMERHDVQARAIRQGIIDGDFAKVQRAAADLSARLPLAGLPERFDAYQGTLRGAVDAIQKAPDLGAAAAGVGELALSCGSCHGSMGIQPPAGSDMPNGEEWEAAMARHAWAADEMWTSLIWMAPDRFRLAVDAWNDTPLVRPHTHDEKRFTSEALALEARAHELAARAAATPDVHQRASLYGQVLATCSSCHQLVRR
jgi:cytochrome c556